MARDSKDALLALLRSDSPMSFRQQFRLTAFLSLPAILAQLSSILMQFIDSAMVGNLGVNAAASVGLVSTCIWLFGGFCSAAASGFYVQGAHLAGAKEFEGARKILRQGISSLLIFSILVAIIGVSLSGHIPAWLGGKPEICGDSSDYLMIVMMGLPAMQMEFFGCGMLQSCGNMKTPSLLSLLMCVLDVAFNFMLIYPTRELSIFGLDFMMPGAGLGVKGAAIGTICAEILTVSVLWAYILCKSKELSIIHEKGSFTPTASCIRNALTISLPMALQNIVMRGAHVASTLIVAPLGTVSIAAHSFAITAESLCYMPGYGIGEAATSLVGQSLGAKRKDLARSFARMTTCMGITVMSLLAVVMFIAAPALMGIMTNSTEVIDLGARMLRIESFAEPMFAASIVIYGVCVGAGDTLGPSIVNFSSMWIVRIIPAIFLTNAFGLTGFWICMCLDLNVRGILFIIRLIREKWMNSISIV